ncbi:MAG: DNA polymerase III subunit delta' [Methyloprofundus sp.]|nr:DNA polymerase III subunit delta' [Methyloprofundus sp.]
MLNEIYPWQDSYWRHLVAYVKQQRIPQALLINGVAGLGKQQLALHFAQYLICLERQEDVACGHCESCKLFMANTHPDFILLAPEEPGKAIGIDSVRQLLKKLALKPQYSGYRVVLIKPAEKMNVNSANAFLKCLEEPPERSVFLLLTEQMQQLPATIISRCQKLLLAPPETSNASLWLQEQGVTEQQKLLLNLAQGAPLQALVYAEENLLEQYQACFTDWQNILLRNTCPVSLAEKWHKLPATLLLRWLISWTEDIIKCHFSVEASLLTNEDLGKHLHVLAKRLDLKLLFEFYKLLLKASDRFHTQLNKQLLFEEILITWSQSIANH